MPPAQIAYLAMVVVGMTSFLAVLGWACFYTRGK
jgi:hypothetical protein